MRKDSECEINGRRIENKPICPTMFRAGTVTLFWIMATTLFVVWVVSNHQAIRATMRAWGMLR